MARNVTAKDGAQAVAMLDSEKAARKRTPRLHVDPATGATVFAPKATTKKAPRKQAPKASKAALVRALLDRARRSGVADALKDRGSPGRTLGHRRRLREEDRQGLHRVPRQGRCEVTPARRKSALDNMDKASPLHKHASWYLRSLRAGGLAANTIDVYLGAVHELDKFLRANDLPRDLASITRDELERFMLDQHTRLKPSTAASRYAGLRSFFIWAVDQGQIEVSPIGKMAPPKVPEIPVPSLTDTGAMRSSRPATPSRSRGGGTRRSSGSCSTPALVARGRRRPAGRHRPDHGAGVVQDDEGQPPAAGPDRRQDVLGDLRLHDRARQAEARHVAVPVAQRVRRAVGGGDRRHLLASGWDGGRLQRRRRRREAPCSRPPDAPYVANNYLEAGGSESNLMALGGWRSRIIMGRYTRSRATERALEEATRIAVGDRF